MTLQEILKAQGLTDEQVEKTIGEMKQNKIFTASEENLDTRYSKLKTDHDTLSNQHKEAQTLIEQLKKGTGDNEALQGKIKDYEGRNAELEAENKRLKAEYALKTALLKADAKPDDLDYLVYKAREKGELKINDDGTLSNQDDLVSGLKTQCPSQFVSAESKSVQEHKLESGDQGASGTVEPKNLAEALKQRYEAPQDKPT